MTLEVNIAKLQMSAIFSLDSKVWLMNDAVWHNSCRAINFALFIK